MPSNQNSPRFSWFFSENYYDNQIKKRPLSGAAFALVVVPFGQLVHVVVQAEDASCQQERLPYVEQKTCHNVVDAYYLIAYHCDAAHYQQYGTSILYALVVRHSIVPPSIPSSAAMR